MLDDGDHTALLAGEEDAARLRCVVASIALVDKDALDRASGQGFGVVNHAGERVTIVGITGQMTWRAGRTARPARADWW